eukprot:2267454-Rhodomonas_salina.2
MSGLKLEFAELIFPSLLFGVYLNARQDRDDQPLRDVGNALQQVPTPKPEPRNPKPETRNPKPDTAVRGRDKPVATMELR